MTPLDAIAKKRAQYTLPSKPKKGSNAVRGKTYAEYLRSPEWKQLTVLVHRRAKHTCEGCGLRKSKEVHHLTYAHVGHEFLFELVALCETCHGRFHDKP